MRRHLCLLWGLLLACVGGASAQTETASSSAHSTSHTAATYRRSGV